MAKKRDYWSRKALFETHADYMLVFGQNCSGKSYQAKEEAIEKAYDLCMGCMLEKYCHEAALHCDLFWMRVDELEGKE